MCGAQLVSLCELRRAQYAGFTLQTRLLPTRPYGGATGRPATAAGEALAQEEAEEVPITLYALVRTLRRTSKSWWCSEISLRPHHPSDSKIVARPRPRTFPLQIPAIRSKARSPWSHALNDSKTLLRARTMERITEFVKD